MPNPIINRRTGGAVAAGSSQSAATTDWVNRVLANGGTQPSAGTVSAVETWYQALVTAGIDSKMIAVNFFAPDSIQAAQTPFFKVLGLDPWTNSGGTSVTVAGLANGGSAIERTGVNPATAFSSSDMGLSIYSAYASASPQNSFGGGDGSTAAEIYETSSVSNFVSSYTPWTVTGSNAGFATAAYGFWSANRTATNLTTLYRANSSNAWGSIGTGSGTGSPASGTGNNAIGFNSSGNAANVSVAVTISFMAVHNGLSSGQGKALYDATQALRVAFGGGFS